MEVKAQMTLCKMMELRGNYKNGGEILSEGKLDRTIIFCEGGNKSPFNLTIKRELATGEKPHGQNGLRARLIFHHD